MPLNQGRRIIAIVGAPASGKSTLAQHLQKQITGSRVLPMDGFHLDNETLDRRNLRARKGAPETFDVSGFLEVIKAARTRADVLYPTFDRALDCSIPNGGQILADDQTILVEGNYLLLKDEPWAKLHQCWDFSIMLDVEIAELEQRLIQRWLEYGHDLEQAQARARGNDLANAAYMLSHSAKADLIG